MKRTLNDITGPKKQLKAVKSAIKKQIENVSDKAASTDDTTPAKVPRITSETISEHREDVLKSARKYIYPLQQSKNKIVIITTSLVLLLVVGFFTYCTLALYKFNNTSTFIYRVTQVIPFPVARVNGRFVSYESYLFELEHYIHYYQAEEGVNFNTQAGKQQLNYYEKLALNEVVDNVYVQELASQNHITVSNEQINNAISVFRQQNRLGSSDTEFNSVLKTYYGWSVDDYKRELKNNLLKQNVVAVLDTATQSKAKSILNQLTSGSDFATLASQYSDDTATKNNGGQYGYSITQSTINIPPQVIAALFSIKQGELTGIINDSPTSASLEIDKNISDQNGQIQAAHILFNFQPVDNYVNPLKQKQPATTYISN